MEGPMKKIALKKLPSPLQGKHFPGYSIGQKIGGIFFLVLLVSAANIVVVKEMLHGLNGVAARLNVAGKLRMLSQKIAFEAATLVRIKNVGSDAAIKSGMRDFSTALAVLRHGGTVFGGVIQKLPSQQQPLLRAVDIDWIRYRSRIEDALAPPKMGIPATKQFEPVIAAAAGLLLSADALTSSIVAETQQTQERALMKIYALMLLDIGVLAAAFVQIRRQLVQPLRELSIHCRELAAGNYHVRSSLRSRDELGQLAHIFNDSAERIGNLLTHIEQDRTALRQAEAMYRGLAENSVVGVSRPLASEQFALLMEPESPAIGLAR